MHYLAAMFTPDISVEPKSTCCNAGDDDSYIALGDNGGLVAKTAPCTCCAGWFCCPVLYSGCGAEPPPVDEKTTEVFEQTMKKTFGDAATQEALRKVADYEEMKRNGEVFGIDLFKRVVEQGKQERTREFFTVHTNLLNLERRKRFKEIDLRKIRARRGSFAVNPHGLELVFPNGVKTKLDKDKIVQEILEIPFTRKVSVEDAEEVMKETLIYITKELKYTSVEYKFMMDIALGFLKGKGYVYSKPQLEVISEVVDDDSALEALEQRPQDMSPNSFQAFMSLVWGSDD